MAEKTVKGIPGVENLGIMSQLVSPFLPFEYSVKQEPRVGTGEVDGSLYYRQIPGQYEYKGLTTPSAVTGGIDFFRNLLEDPTGTATGIASAIKQEVEELPERQLRTGMSGGETFNPETGEIERYDPLLVPLLQGAGTAASIARISDESGTVLGNMGGRLGKSGQEKFKQAEEFARKYPGTSNDLMFKKFGVYFDPKISGADYADVKVPDAFRYEIPTHNSTLKITNIEEEDFKRPADLLHRTLNGMRDSGKFDDDFMDSYIKSIEEKSGSKVSVQDFQNSDNGEFLHASSEGFGLKPDTPVFIDGFPFNPFITELNMGGGKFIKANRPRLKDILNFPELYEEYPQLKDIFIVRFKDEGNRGHTNFTGHERDTAGYIEEGLDGYPTIAIGNTEYPEAFQSNLLHEVQHAIQHIEDFPQGSSPQAIMERFEEIFDQVKEEFPDAEFEFHDFFASKMYNQMYGEVEARLVQEKFEQMRQLNEGIPFTSADDAMYYSKRLNPLEVRRTGVRVDDDEIIFEEDLPEEFQKRGFIIEEPNFFKVERLIDFNKESLLGGDKPQRFYHGTTRQFENFDPEFNVKTAQGPEGSVQKNRGSYYFTPNPEAADLYAKSGKDPRTGEPFKSRDPETGEFMTGAVQGSRVIPVYLKQGNYFDVDNPDHLKTFKESAFYKENKEKLDEKFKFVGADFDTLLKSGEELALEEITPELKKLGFQGHTTYLDGNKNIAVYDTDLIVSGIAKKAKGGAVSPNFVSRIMDPKSPMTQDNAMVQLMDFSVDGRFFVAPTVFPVDSPVGPVLTKFSPDMAIRKAFNTGEFLEFDTADQAKEFAIRFTDVINVEDRPKQNLKDGIAKFIPMMQ